MIFHKTKLDGVWLIELEPKIDARGFYMRNFAKEEFAKNGIDFNIVHVNRSLNKIKGTTRGFHYQQPPKCEDKLLQALKGKFYDVVLDLRKGSKTYLRWLSFELDAEKKNMLLCPKGCTNAIQVLEDNSELQYFVTEYYWPEREKGIRFNDPLLKIKWPFPTPVVISEKDAGWPLIDKNSPPAIDLRCYN